MSLKVKRCFLIIIDAKVAALSSDELFVTRLVRRPVYRVLKKWVINKFLAYLRISDSRSSPRSMQRSKVRIPEVRISEHLKESSGFHYQTQRSQAELVGWLNGLVIMVIMVVMVVVLLVAAMVAKGVENDKSNIFIMLESS